MPGRHADSGLSSTTVSVMLSGAGSVDVSARAILATTAATSGTVWMARFCFRAISMAWGSETAGSLMGMNIRSPSLSGGMNSRPIRGTSDTAPASTSAAAASVRTRWRRAQPSTGRYSQVSGRITGLSSSRRTRPPIRRLHSTGTSVTDRTVAPTMAKVLVNASGWNSLPSCPVSAKTGTKARMMTAIEKKMGRPTRRVASSTAAVTAARSRTFTRRSVTTRNAFSVTTMAASTRTPMAMAIPASDMMFEVMPRYRMNRNAVRTASGMGMVTIRTERRWSRNRMLTRVTTAASSSRERLRVSAARRINAERS